MIIDDDAARAFVLEHTVATNVPLVPEITLRLADESTALWRATETWLEARNVPPPYWAFAWAGGQALARYVLDHPALVAGRTVVDFGTGGGIVAIAAALARAARVIAADRDPVALACCALNAALNGVRVEPLLTAGVDDLPPSDVLLAGDVFYERAEGPAVVAALRRRSEGGTLTYVACPGRVATPTALDGAHEKAVYDVPGVLELEGKETRRSRVLAFVSAPGG